MQPDIETSALFGPDGTADPPPAPGYADPLAGLVTAESPVTATLGGTVRVTVPRPPSPDSEEVRRAIAALAGTDEPAPDQPGQQSQRQQPQRRQAQQQRPQQQRPRAQPQPPPRAQQPGGDRWVGSQWRQSMPRRGGAEPARARKSGVLLVVLIILAIVLFNAATALFHWLGSLFP